MVVLKARTSHLATATKSCRRPRFGCIPILLDKSTSFMWVLDSGAILNMCWYNTSDRSTSDAITSSLPILEPNYTDAMDLTEDYFGFLPFFDNALLENYTIF